MLKRIKALIMAILMAMVFPVFRIPGDNDTPPAGPPGGNNQDTRNNNQEKDNNQTPKINPPAGPPASQDPQAGTPVPLDKKVKELEGLLAGKETELSQAKEKITGLEKSTTESAARLNQLDSSLKKAVTGYKSLVVQNNPDILPELISGDSIEALDNSLIKARELTNKIKTNLQDRTRNARIPAGAPQRGNRDNSGLSARDKIREGIGRK